MKKLILSIIVFCIAICSFAIPAKRIPITLTQSDGTQITVYLCGDESYHYYTNLKGTPLINENGMFREANETEAEAMETTFVNKVKARNLVRAKKVARRKTDGYTGTKKALVILVNFSDLSMKSTSSQAAFNSQFNDEGYNKGNHIGSVRDYFKDQSYGKLTIDFDVVGPYTVSKQMTYYGKNDASGNDLHVGEMIIEAIKLADKDVDYSDYDWDGDGEVDQIFVIYAGYAESEGAAASTIWPQEYDLDDLKEGYNDGTGSQTLDGKKINTYACSSELQGTSGNTMSGIGTAVHEFSHCLGLPDLYDTSNSGNYGMGMWSVMCAGNYNGPTYGGSEVPAGFTSYERILAGWLTPKELNSACNILNMQPLTTEGEAYIIYNQANKDEYYLLENRQAERWDQYIGGHGMLVVHLDYDEDAWYYNEINNTAGHERCTIIPADNSKSYYNISGDPYPGTSNNTSLTDSSTPAASLYHANSSGKKYMGKAIEDISESSGLISFKFMGGEKIEIPSVLDPTNITANSFTARWSSVEDAESYKVELHAKNKNATPTDMIQLEEDFSKCNSSSKTNGQDIASNLSSYTQTSGWTGYKVFNSYSGYVKIGSGNNAGYIITPSLDAPTSFSVTINLSSEEYKSGTTVSTVVSILSANGATLSTKIITCGTSSQTITFNDINEAYKVKINPSARLYLTGITVYDGDFLAEDLVNKISRKVAASTIISDIVDTCYTFENLDTAYTYSYRVCTAKDGFYSDWSDWKQVELQKTAEDINNDGQVDSQDIMLIYEFMKNSTKAVTSDTKEDVNKDGLVDSQDVLKVYDYMKNN